MRHSARGGGAPVHRPVVALTRRGRNGILTTRGTISGGVWGLNWLTRVSRRLATANGAAAGAPWGDGLVDEGFDLLSGAADWSEVSNDELVFLIPLLRATGLPRDPARRRILPLLGAAKARRAAGIPADEPLLAAHATAWIEACIAAVEAGGSCPPASLCDAVVLSWETRANAAYWLPEFEPMQETLAAAAWLGVLCAGRPALLPWPLADVLETVLPQATETDPWGLAATALRHRMQAAGVIRPIERALASIRSGSPAVLVKPGRPPSRPPAPPDALARALAASLPQRPAMDERAARSGSA